MKDYKLPSILLTILLTAMLMIVTFQPVRSGTDDGIETASAVPERTRSGIEFRDPEYVINASQYDFPIDLSDVESLQQILYYYPINESQEEYLRNHGFVNLGKTGISGGNGNYDLVNLYKNLKEYGFAPYVTTDAMLHVYHIFFDELLKNIEEDHFINALTNMTLKLINATEIQYKSVSPNTMDMIHTYEADSVYGPVSYTITETISLKKACLKNLAYLYVPLSILAPNVSIPAAVKEDVLAELELIEANEGFDASPIFDKSDVHWMLNYVEDYSQYTARGHYTRSEQLARYFKAMMWYGRMAFRTKSAMETVQAVMLADAMQSRTADTWNGIYQVTSFFVGKSDDLTPIDYKVLTSHVFGAPGSTYSGLLDKTKIRLYMDKVNELRKPRICSAYVRADLEDIVNATMGLKLMGQRLVPDSYMFQNLVFPSVLEYEGTGTPFTMSEIVGWGDGKGFPRGLEAMAILGSDMAEDYLIRDGDVEYDRYDHQYGKLKAEFSNINKTTWESNLYWGWLYALDSLNEDFTESRYPSYMRNRGYLAEKLNTNLGSWTELRHDTILYAKQSYTPTCGISEIIGYVEPIPDLYSRLRDLTNSTKENLEEFGMISNDTAENLDAFSDLLGRLQDFSERELNNIPLNSSEYESIKRFGWELEKILKDIPDDAGDSRLIADVHTDANRDPADGEIGKVLEEAVGNFDMILVIWNDTANSENGSLRASVGPIFSYYEFKHPMSDRLTDEKWRQILEEGTDVPEQFDWQDYPLDYPDLVDVADYYDLWVSTEEIYFSEGEDDTDIVMVQTLVHNRNMGDRDAEVTLYLDSIDESSVIKTFDITAPGHGASLIGADWNVTGMDKGIHRIFVNVSTNDDNDYRPQNNLAMGFVDLTNVSGQNPDWDGDGVVNIFDDFPFDPAASLDTDGDGYPDEWNPGMDQDDSTTGLSLDAFPYDPLEWMDSDLDGVGDNSDAFPLDPNEWRDTDGDGIGDNSDMFPGDPLEWIDTDGDGIGDNSDAFPNDPSEWADRDGDGVGDNSDMFPDDPKAWIDSDLDGYHDGIDEFPFDPHEWIDSDGDGVGDNSDGFPNDPLEWIDSDGDGVGDNSDSFPNDPLEWIDSDGDGVGDNSDAFPDDPDRWDSIGTVEDVDNGDKLAILAVAVLIVVMILVILTFVIRQRIGGGGERLSRYWDDVVNDRVQEEGLLEDGEFQRLLRDRYERDDISHETYREIMSTHVGDEY
ncbi:MAG: DUF3160 domain-containing protein [Thermoplasmatota archaeon]